MVMTTPRPCGECPSPVGTDTVAAAGLKLGQTAMTADGAVAWTERRPDEGGRTTVVMADERGTRDLVPAPYDVRSAVHEYGGGAFVLDGSTLWFVNSEDQCVYRVDANGTVTRLTPPDRGLSFADLQVDRPRRCLIAVCEDHDADPEPRSSLVAISEDGAIRALAAGPDFIASPRLSPDGRRLVWLSWDHPNMPWDGTTLWQLDLAGDGEPVALAGGPAESLFQPIFAPDGSLHVVSDASGWWNICRHTDDGLVPVTHETAEFGVPQWIFGQSTVAFDDDGGLYAVVSRDGFAALVSVARDSGRLRTFDLPFTHLEQLRASGGRLIFIGGSATTAPTLCTLNADGSGLQRLQASADSDWPEAVLSTPDAVRYPTADGAEAHALYYPPRHPDWQVPDGERPPLLIKCHGGPTGATVTALDPRIQFWTSRGFAVLDVNYRGSVGYGRAYREALYGAWGVADVADCVHGARYLAAQGLADPERVVISGSSAGGYTVLSVLTFAEVAAAGASYYGIGDLERLLASTHKFESRYLLRLIGEDPALLRARSPLHHADRLTCPVLFLQGLKDKVVPPDQAETMVTALRRQGVPAAHITFPEERHGFRAAANIRTAIGAELAFYGRILGFTPADTDLPQVPLQPDHGSP